MPNTECINQMVPSSIRIKNKIFIDSNGNKFDLRDYTLKQAMSMSKMLVKCSECHKSEDCKELSTIINNLGEK